MPLGKEQIEEIALRVVSRLNADEAAGKPSADGDIFVPFDSKPDGKSRVSFEFETQAQLEDYLDQHPAADKKLHSVKPQKSRRGPAEAQPEERTIRLRDEQGKEHVVREQQIADYGWESHSVSLAQVTPHTKIFFADGASKLYSELTAEEKRKVDGAIKEGVAHTRGMNDYTKVNLDTLQKNMNRNLSRYSTGVREVRNNSSRPVGKTTSASLAKKMEKTGSALLERYAPAMTKVSRGKMETFVESYIGAVRSAIDDDSLKGIAESDIDEYFRSDIKTLLHQEIETRRRSMGDHGIRHAVANAMNSAKMLDELSKSGVAVSGIDKLMALSIQVNHDIGYTVGAVATDTSKGKLHKGYSTQLLDEGVARQERIFGTDRAREFINIVDTHDVNDINWETYPVASAVRLADSITLFGEDKVQDLFVRSPKALEVVGRMRLAAESGDEELALSLKKELHGIVDEGEYEEEDKEALHQQVSEMSESGFSTTLDILSRFSGRITELSYDGDAKKMIVGMKYSKEGEIVDSVFGDKTSARQFEKFIADMGTGESEGGVTDFKSNGRVAFSLRRDTETDSDKDGTTEHSEVLADFAKHTVRPTLSKARLALKEGDGKGALESLKNERDKFSDKEWLDIEKLFRENDGDLGAVYAALSKWPLLARELMYLGRGGSMDVKSSLNGGNSRRNSRVARIASSRWFSRFAGLTDEEKQEVVEKVKAKLNQGDDGKQDADEKSDDGKQDAAESYGYSVDGLDDEGETEEGETEEGETEEGETEEGETEEGDDTEITVDIDGTLDEAGTEAENAELEDEGSDEGIVEIPVGDAGLPDGEPGSEPAEQAGDLVEQMADGLEFEKDAQFQGGREDVLSLVRDTVKMVNSLVESLAGKEVQREASARRYAAIIDRVAASGYQCQRKDKDLMRDTGGVSKGRPREPNIKPPRERNRYKPQRQTSETRDRAMQDRDTRTSADKAQLLRGWQMQPKHRMPTDRNLGTRVHPDKSKFQKKQRKHDKAQLRREWQ